MDIKKTFKNVMSSLRGQELYTRKDVQFFANRVRSEQGIKITAELIKHTDALTKKDIGMWRNAWQMAINVDSPNRAKLYDIYADNVIDMHLTGAMGQRNGMTTSCDFRLIGKDGKDNDKAAELFRQEWFNQYIEYVLESIYYGHSLIQFGDIVKGDCMKFRNVELVPRKHVCPEHGVFKREVSDDWKDGISYRDGEFSLWSLEAGSPNDLGLLLKCSPHCISKRNMCGFWDMFGEIFGAPMRIAKATTTDAKERSEIENALENMGSAFWGLFPDGTDIEIKESSRGDAYEVFDKRIDRCNSELSKGILFQTMTIDSGSSLSQSKTHLEVLKNLVERDKKKIEYNINGALIPFMQMHGFPIDGCHFAWDDTEKFTPAEQREMERVILDHFDCDPKYFEEKYNIKINGKKKTKEEPDAFFR